LLDPVIGLLRQHHARLGALESGFTCAATTSGRVPAFA
jgi:hypothetical protein